MSMSVCFLMFVSGIWQQNCKRMSELASNNKKMDYFKSVQFMWINLNYRYSEFIFFDISMMEYGTTTSSHYSTPFTVNLSYLTSTEDVISKKHENFDLELFQAKDYLKLGFRQQMLPKS